MKNNKGVGYFAIFILIVVFAVVVYSVVSFFSSSGANSESQEATPGEYIDDSVITTKVKSKLGADDFLKSFQISVETRKGIVQLSGFVNTQKAIDKAGEIANNVKGVQSVKNDLSVKESQDESVGEYVDDSVITTTVKSKLGADDFLKSFQIGVETRKGIVQLSGFVNTQKAIDKAVEIAKKVKGVQSVKNDLIVKE
jgi:hyperosmotically inducible protein